MIDRSDSVRIRGRRGARPAAGTRQADTAGGLLERRVARLEFAQGALVRLRVPVYADNADSGRDRLTDIDVLSADVDLRLRVTRSSTECKSGGGQAGEPSTLIWTAGFRQLMALDRVALVRSSISRRGRALAKRVSVEVVDEHTLTVRERDHTWLPETFAHVDGEECLAAEARTDMQMRGLSDIPQSLVSVLRHEALLAPASRLLTAVQALGRAADRQGVLPEPCATILGGHALMAVLLSAVQDAGRLDTVPIEQLRISLRRSLATGDAEDDSLLAAMERADALVRYLQERTHRAYVDAGAEMIAIDVPSLRDTLAAPPTWLEDYLDLVQRLRGRPLVARDVLQTAELLCFDAILGARAWKAPAFQHLFTAEHRALVLAAQRCLASIAGRVVAQPLGELTALAAGAASAESSHQERRQGHPQDKAPAPSGEKEMDG